MKILVMTLPRVCLASLVLLLSLQSAQAQQYKEGVDYIKVSGFTEMDTPTVREFFAYNCGHCYRQDPFFEQTANLLKSQVKFDRTPVAVGRSSWILSQMAYYLAEKFKLTNQVHSAIFKRIHEQGGAFTELDQVEDFFIQQGLAAENVKMALNSADAKLALLNYDTQAQLAEIKGVPSLLVNGQYLIIKQPDSPKALAEMIKSLSLQSAQR